MDWYRKRTLGGILDEAARRWGPREALVFGSRRWTYAELDAETDRVARALMALGVEPGENVALWMTNRPEWVFVMFAVARVGACLVPLNTRYRTDDVAYTLRQSRSGTLITLDRSGPVDYQGMLMETMTTAARRDDGTLAVDGYPDLKRVVVLGEPRLAHASDWAAFMAAGAAVGEPALAARKAAVDPDGRMVICYTSGTTGHPKGAVHSHRPIRNAHERAQMFGMTMHDIHMSYLPLFHIYGYSEIAMGAVLVGAKQILMEVFDAERALDLAEQERATVLHGFEAHWLDLLNAQARRPRRARPAPRHPALRRPEHGADRRPGAGRLRPERQRLGHERDVGVHLLRHRVLDARAARARLRLPHDRLRVPGGRPRDRGRAAARRARRIARARLHRDGRLLGQARRPPPPPSTRRDGCTPGTWPSSGTTATWCSWAATRTCSRSAARTCRRPRSRPICARWPRCATRRWSPTPIRAWPRCRWRS